MEGPLHGSTTDTRLTLTSLPPEILGEIFVQCSSQYPDSPLLLRQVSKSLQAIVHGTPRAWEHLTLHHRNSNDRTSNASSDKARMWFKHSGSCFVHVRVEIEQPSLSIPKLWNAGNACQGTASGPEAKDALTNALAAHVDRIRTLDVLAPSEPEARSLLDALYPSPSASPTFPETLIPATQSISIRISSTTPPNLRLSSLASPSPFPLLPALQSLKLTNHTISFMSAADGCDLGSLRELEIECPIRFQPIRVGEVMGILRRAGRLERLRVESRVVDDDNEAASPSQMTPFSANGVASPIGSAFPSRSSTPPPTPSPSSPSLDPEEDPTPTPTPSLVHLPHLTSLSLRTNAIPALLSHLLLPNLAELKLEDLNGKRRGASAETAGVLRQMLVRMELPNEYRVGKGLRRFEVVGVDVQVPTVPVAVLVPEQQGALAIGAEPGMGSTLRKEGDDATWAWCFKRMVSLEEIAVSKTDVAPVLEVLAPQASSPTSLPQSSQRGSPIEPRPSSPFRSPSSTAVDAQRSGDLDVVCPRLRRCTLSTSSPISPALVDRFAAQRPNVDLKVDVVQDPFFQSLKTGPVDFLSLYCDGPNAATRTAGVGETSGKGGAGTKPARRMGTRPAFGPWVVLA
ncbi:hypothetical protein FA13DRAFT_1690592 [Coprinellus micaceus]|uniref:F-box domain-containing protein n=1 Tax=Coprinellus micaceus TaxID=71717 RepID=A0A4Y7T4Y3_COPMI|nr:hypothetical protein FA13DRAFT_1690592 [Coprinellus micaceus]